MSSGSIMMTTRRLPVLLAATAVLASSVTCQRVPLLAPSGSTITLTTGVTALPVNGTADIVAQVIEPSGTPPQNGTHVTFTTTLGTIQPAEAETDISGRVVAKFLAGTSNGTATITAISGGASTGTDWRDQDRGRHRGGRPRDRQRQPGVGSQYRRHDHHFGVRLRHQRQRAQFGAGRASRRRRASCRPRSPPPTHSAWPARC